MNQFLSKKTKFQYEDTSNKLFSKIEIVNALTNKDIDKFNFLYKKFGLYIKQVEVDNFGNQLYQTYNINSVREKRLKRPMMTLKEFYNKYYFVTEFSKITKIKKNKKLLKTKKKKKKNEVNESMDLSEVNDESSLDEEYFRNLKKNLIDIYHDIQNIEYKDCKIADDNFKLKIIEYIRKFKNFLSDKQYNILVSKWRNELIKIKGVNPLDKDSLDDLSMWKTPILKGLKSEIVLLAMSNVLGKKIGEEEINNEEQKENNKIEEKKKEDASDSSSSFSESDSVNNENNDNDNDKEKNDSENYNFKDGEDAVNNMEKNNNKKIVQDDDDEDDEDIFA